MARRRTPARSIALLGATAIIAAGCGGGEETLAPVTESATPAPVTDGSTVADPTAPQATADLDGDGTLDVDADGDGIKDPVDPAAPLGATASVPNLSGGDIGGGLGTVGGAPLFEAGAISIEDLEELQDAKEQKAAAGSTVADHSTDTTGPSTKEPAATYTSAKVYIDGIVHEVSKGAAFPKDNPVFRLLQVNAGSIEVELIAGEFTTGGGSGVVLDKGELVSLVNASEQLTYRVKFMRATEGSTAVSF